jgi:aspartate/methionine/tyrosine aminotransferase
MTLDAWFDVTSTGMGSQEFLKRLSVAENVALSPGDRFGADGFIRVPLVLPVPQLEEVVDRLKAFKSSL